MSPALAGKFFTASTTTDKVALTTRFCFFLFWFTPLALQMVSFLLLLYIVILCACKSLVSLLCVQESSPYKDTSQIGL